MFSAYDNIKAGLSLKEDGNMKCSTEDAEDTSFKNRELFFKKQGLDNKDVVSAGLVHGGQAAVIGSDSRGKSVAGYDALITDQPGAILTVTVADCLPLYFYDRAKQAIALAHAGWRGVLTPITKNVLAALATHYGSRPADIEVFIGPHLQKCHFTVKEDVASQFVAYPSLISRSDKIYIDLAGIVRQQLIEAGVRSEQIRSSDECTYELADKYFSYRRDGGELQTMIAYLRINPIV
ncbi:MAG: peptidoglycan editing factor PgeF [Patescibacteria group bacterium]